MQNNIGNTDRVFRIIAGIIVLAIGAYYGSWWGLVGLVPLLTGLMRFCPLYRIFGISSCKNN